MPAADASRAQIPGTSRLCFFEFDEGKDLSLDSGCCRQVIRNCSKFTVGDKGAKGAKAPLALGVD